MPPHGAPQTGCTIPTDVSISAYSMMQLIKVPVSDRSKVLAELRQQGFSDSLVLWMASNLVPASTITGQPQASGKPAPQPLVWGFDVNGAVDLYEDYKQVDCWDALKSPPRGTTMNVLRAERSDRWTEGMIRTLKDCAAAAELVSPEVCQFSLLEASLRTSCMPLLEKRTHPGVRHY